MNSIADSKDIENLLKWTEIEKARLWDSLKELRTAPLHHSRFNELLRSIEEGTFDEDKHALAKRVDYMEAEARHKAFADSGKKNMFIEPLNVAPHQGNSPSKRINIKKLSAPLFHSAIVKPITNSREKIIKSDWEIFNSKKQCHDGPILKDKKSLSSRSPKIKLNEAKKKNVSIPNHPFTQKKYNKDKVPLNKVSLPALSICPLTKQTMPGLNMLPDCNNTLNNIRHETIVCRHVDTLKQSVNLDSKAKLALHLDSMKEDMSESSESVMTEPHPQREHGNTYDEIQSTRSMERYSSAFDGDAISSQNRDHFCTESVLENLNIVNFTTRLEQRLNEILPFTKGKTCETSDVPQDETSKSNVLSKNSKEAVYTSEEISYSTFEEVSDDIQTPPPDSNTDERNTKSQSDEFDAKLTNIKIPVATIDASTQLGNYDLDLGLPRNDQQFELNKEQMSSRNESYVPCDVDLPTESHSVIIEVSAISSRNYISETQQPDSIPVVVDESVHSEKELSHRTPDSMPVLSSSGTILSLSIEIADTTISEGEIRSILNTTNEKTTEEDTLHSSSIVELKESDTERLPDSVETEPLLEHTDSASGSLTSYYVTHQSCSHEGGTFSLAEEALSESDGDRSSGRYSQGQLIDSNENLSHLSVKDELKALYFENQQLRRHLAFVPGRFCKNVLSNK